MNRLKERYEQEITKSLMTKFNYSSVMQVPALEKIVINIGVGDAVSNSKLLDEAVEEREKKSLLSVKDNYRKVILTMDNVKNKQIDGIEVINIIDFLMNSNV